jgi:hypothetical protein
VIPDLATDGEGSEGIGDAPVVDELLHEEPVEFSLVRCHPDQQHVLTLRRQRQPQYLVASTENQINFY